MTREISQAEEVKTLERHMGLFGKAFTDLSEKVKCLEEKTKSNSEREIKEIIEAQRVIDEILVANSDAIKKLNSEIAKVQDEPKVVEKKVVERKVLRRKWLRRKWSRRKLLKRKLLQRKERNVDTLTEGTANTQQNAGLFTLYKIVYFIWRV